MEYLIQNKCIRDYDLSIDLVEYFAAKNIITLIDLKHFLTEKEHPIPDFHPEWLLEIIELFKGLHKEILINEAMLNVN
jgi:hypothetical protein